MKQLNLNEIKMVLGGVGGGVNPPDNPPRGTESESTNTDRSFQPASLPVEPDEG
ncbi:hypothetical protein [Pseudoalteromonas phenolica]|uniref:hypothetical protein n=1 Tax=Pseudoalteromonas phenolica TaxID=161398 RepID=UPI001486B1CF|nr:hypothetical protein [Pseudoalteromonas phenolica]